MRINKDKPNAANGFFNYRESLKKPADTFINRIIKVERYLNRPLAAVLVRLVYDTRVTPNGLTFLSFFTGIVGAFFLSLGKDIFFVLGGLVVQLSSIIDCADGMLARSKNLCSEYGSYLDLFLDRIVDYTVIICISVGVYRAFDDKNLLFLGVLSAGLYLLQVNLFYLTNSYLKINERGQTGEARALMLLAVMIFGVINRLDIAIYLLLAQTLINIAVRVIYFIRLGRRGDLKAPFGQF